MISAAKNRFTIKFQQKFTAPRQDRSAYRSLYIYSKWEDDVKIDQRGRKWQKKKKVSSVQL